MGAKWPGRETDRSPQYRIKVETEWNFTFAPPYAIMQCTGRPSQSGLRIHTQNAVKALDSLSPSGKRLDGQHSRSAAGLLRYSATSYHLQRSWCPLIILPVSKDITCSDCGLFQDAYPVEELKKTTETSVRTAGVSVFDTLQSEPCVNRPEREADY